jgi:hypothetical protein
VTKCFARPFVHGLLSRCIGILGSHTAFVSFLVKICEVGSAHLLRIVWISKLCQTMRTSQHMHNGSLSFLIRRVRLERIGTVLFIQRKSPSSKTVSSTIFRCKGLGHVCPQLHFRNDRIEGGVAFSSFWRTIYCKRTIVRC